MGQVKERTKSKSRRKNPPAPPAEKLEPFSSMVFPRNHTALKVYAAHKNKKVYEALNDVLEYALPLLMKQL